MSWPSLSRARTFALYTLGCKVNQYESQVLREVLEREGYRLVPFNGKADLYIVNTCTVTSTSDQKSRQMVRAALRRNPDGFLAVTGCYAQTNPEDLLGIPGVDLVAGCREGFLEALVGRRDGELSISRFSGHTRAFVKIQDGCNWFCSYCKIPYARGNPRSRPIEKVVDEVGRLTDNGYKEVVLTGVNLGLYGLGLNFGLPKLIKSLSSISGLFRLRLSSLEVTEVGDELLEEMASNPKLCFHLHIPLQSGEDSILKRMNRRYGTDDFQRRVEEVRRRIPEISITTDLMVGFPGETEESFERSLKFIERIRFTRAHIFSFSPRPGTKAAQFKDNISSRAKEERARRLRDLIASQSFEYRRSLVGKEREILIEGRRVDGLLCGYSEDYIRVLVDGLNGLMNEVVRVRISSVSPEATVGELV